MYLDQKSLLYNISKVLRISSGGKGSKGQRSLKVIFGLKSCKNDVMLCLFQFINRKISKAFLSKLGSIMYRNKWTGFGSNHLKVKGQRSINVKNLGKCHEISFVLAIT